MFVPSALSGRTERENTPRPTVACPATNAWSAPLRLFHSHCAGSVAFFTRGAPYPRGVGLIQFLGLISVLGIEARGTSLMFMFYSCSIHVLCGHDSYLPASKIHAGGCVAVPPCSSLFPPVLPQPVSKCGNAETRKRAVRCSPVAVRRWGDSFYTA